VDNLQQSGIPTTTLVNTQARLSSNVGDLIIDPLIYRSHAGGLQYLTLTWSDIAYVIQQACLHMHDPMNLILC
jgi:hypothetical protein